MRLAFALLAWAGLAQAAAVSPPWVDDVIGVYSGAVRNAGRLECHRTEFSLHDGQLVGHYWIDDPDPFEGELTGFVPDSDTSGVFVWTDRYGTGREYVAFDPAHGSFRGYWGDAQPTINNPVWGIRGGTAGCAGAVS